MASVVICCCAVILSVGGGLAMMSNPVIDQFINKCPCFTLPEAGELSGEVVVIDPVAVGPNGGGVREADDGALTVGAFLYHLIMAAGGVPVMTRAEERGCCLEEEVGSIRLSRWVERCQASVVVSIDCGGACVNPMGMGSASGALAARFSAALGLGCGEAIGSLAATGVLVRIGLSAGGVSGHSGRLACWEQAERLYSVLRDFLNGDSAAAPHAGCWSTSVPRFPNRTEEQEVEAASRRVWPVGALPVEQAEWFCRMLCASISDRTNVYLSPKVRYDGGKVVIEGATNVAILKGFLAESLRTVGVKDVVNDMRVLPEEGALNGDSFGVCSCSMALTYGEPDESSSMCSQLLYGEPVMLLDRDGSFYLIHGSDGYCGWVRCEAVEVVSRMEYLSIVNSKSGIMLDDVEMTECRLLAGTRLAVSQSRKGIVRVAMPDGDIELSEEAVGVLNHDARVVEIVERATQFLYRPYIFGAVSPIGLDCSGLVKNVMSQVGLQVARDASQQMLAGRLVASRWCRDGILAGDLLYFINGVGKVYHVAIAISSTYFIHSAPPGVRINSLAIGDRLYSAYRDRTFLMAKRM